MQISQTILRKFNSISLTLNKSVVLTFAPACSDAPPHFKNADLASIVY